MFRQLFQALAAGNFNNQLAPLFHPSEHADYLEQFWAGALPAFQQERQFQVPAAPPGTFLPPGQNRIIAALPLLVANTEWHHLIYAYMVERSGICDIIRTVVKRCLSGERIGVPNPQAQVWLENTEQLLYMYPPSFSVYGVKSHLRWDPGETRSNAYHRMFGLHTGDDPTERSGAK